MEELEELQNEEREPNDAFKQADKEFKEKCDGTEVDTVVGFFIADLP